MENTVQECEHIAAAGYTRQGRGIRTCTSSAQPIFPRKASRTWGRNDRAGPAGRHLRQAAQVPPSGHDSGRLWRKMDIFKIIRQKKAIFLLAQLVMSSFYRPLGEKLGVQPGAEMLEGIRMAEQTGCACPGRPRHRRDAQTGLGLSGLLEQTQARHATG